METYKWNEFTEESSDELVFGLLQIVVDKFNDGVDGWKVLDGDDDKLRLYFSKVIDLLLNKSLTLSQLPSYVSFFIYAFRSLEIDSIRRCVMPLCGLQLWYHVHPRRRNMELQRIPRLFMTWEKMELHREMTGVMDSLQSNGLDKQYNQLKSTLSSFDTSMQSDPMETLHTARDVLHSATTALADKEVEVSSTPVASTASFFPLLFTAFFNTLASPVEDTGMRFCVKVVELVTDLLAQSTTRRYLIVYIRDCHFGVRTRLSGQYETGSILDQMLQRMKYYEGFVMDEYTGAMVDETEAEQRYYKKISVLQNLLFKYYRTSLEELCMTSVQMLATRKTLSTHLSSLPLADLRSLAVHLRLAPPEDEEETMDDDGLFAAHSVAYTQSMLIEIIVDEYARPEDAMTEINNMALLPDEHTLWDERLLPTKRDGSDVIMALPKLNLQFLSFGDYLRRNFTLYRMECYTQLRTHLADTIRRMHARLDMAGATAFTGQSRVAVPLHSFFVTEVLRARVGDSKPAEVRADATFSLSGLRGDTRKAWEALREHDILFLVTIQARNRDESDYSFGSLVETKDSRVATEWNEEQHGFLQREGVVSVRGCEVVHMEDEDGVVLNDLSNPDTRLKRAGKRRILRVRLDTAQYQHDMEQIATGAIRDPYVLNGDITISYERFNLLVRRDAAENTFKAVLDTLRQLLNLSQIDSILPSWLQPVLLGTGSPAAAHYSRLATPASVRYGDTFISGAHVVAAFPQYRVIFRNDGNDVTVDAAQPPFMLTFPARDDDGDEVSDELICSTYSVPVRDSFLAVEVGDACGTAVANTLQFTAAQTEAIRSGLNPGLTVVVGPPGTGKTDVVVQTVVTLYHDYPTERVLIVTHSNHALNDLFSKIALRDVDGRHVLRLGQGERELDSDEDFSRMGRVDYCLRRRQKLLDAVRRLAISVGAAEDVAYSCETCAYFYNNTIVPRIQLFNRVSTGVASEADIAALKVIPACFTESQRQELTRWMEINTGDVADLFPFKLFFLSFTQPVFPAESDGLACAAQCIRTIRSMFSELSEYRPFELLRNNRHRADYILNNQAHIVAMTCTHAAMTRAKLLESGFKYDTLVIEECGQILELEAFIPVILQNVSSVDSSRLKRVILLGDHNQLPPIVQNESLRRATHFDQSLFSRLIRLGVPHITLDAQGRCRPSLATLFSWRYDNLQDLPHVLPGGDPQFSLANACMRYEYQLVDVGDYEGEGEMKTAPHVYQNHGEAEYVLAVYEYLRLCGYPADHITLLTTYNGQRELLRQMAKERCGKNVLFGMPHKITTVDKYQGQQNDIVLLSLVRTRSVGYLRDIRRMIVAMSRARFGLYVFCRAALFTQCFELQDVMRMLVRPVLKLQLVEGESYPTQRMVDEEVAGFEVMDVTHMMQIVVQFYEARRQQYMDQNQA